MLSDVWVNTTRFVDAKNDPGASFCRQRTGWRDYDEVWWLARQKYAFIDDLTAVELFIIRPLIRDGPHLPILTLEENINEE